MWWGGLHSHDDLCAGLCHRTGFDAVAAGDRPAPEHRHPASCRDAVAVAEALLQDGAPLLLAGDSGGRFCRGQSGGGNLAAALALTLRGRGQGQVLICPGLGG